MAMTFRSGFRVLGALALVACATQAPTAASDPDAGDDSDASVADAARDHASGPPSRVDGGSDGQSQPDSASPAEGGGPDALPDVDTCVVPDAAPDAACIAVQNECTCASQCCGAAGLTCDRVGGLLVRWCCVQAGYPCTGDNDCCGQHLCKPGDGGVLTCQ